MKIKPQYIGSDLNLPNLADQCVAKLKSLNCWYIYASGKASIGRKSSVEAISRMLKSHGMSEDYTRQFIRDVIERLRLEQRSDLTARLSTNED